MVNFTLEQVMDAQKETRSILGQRPVPTSLRPGKRRSTQCRRLGSTQGQAGRVRKISPSPGFDPRNFQPVASHPRYPGSQLWSMWQYGTHSERIQNFSRTRVGKTILKVDENRIGRDGAS